MEYILGEPNTTSKRIASFDLDGTLITPKSKKRFADNYKDWIFCSDTVELQLANLHKEGYLILIISNKREIGTKRLKNEDFQQKLTDIHTALNVPFICYYSINDDIYRKPRTGLWEKFVTTYKITEIDKDKSFYCGDAAGRPIDFSDTDYKFALNIGLNFKLPMQQFGVSGSDLVKILPMPPHPTTFLETGKYDLDFLYEYSDQHVVMMCGLPASGKSTISNIIAKDGYEIVSKDKLKTKAKCKGAFIAHLKTGSNIVIDNTNATKSQRKEWIQILNKFSKKIPMIIINVTTPKQTALHINTFRKLYTLDDAVPDVAIHTINKRYEEPTLEEGFAKIETLQFKMDETKDNTYLLSYLR